MKRLSRPETALCLAALIALLGMLAAPISLGAESRPIRFERLSLEEGLSQTSVLAITQDSEGFMWFGTEDGLNRFDGYTFTHFKNDHSNPRALINDFIRDLDEDADGNLWIATDGGVARLNRATGEFKLFRADPADAGALTSDAIRAIVVDREGSVWVGTRHDGLARLDPQTGSVSHFRHDRDNPASLSHNEVNDIILDRAGRLWVATNAGLNRLDIATGEFKHFRHDPGDPASLSDDRVRCILEDRSGTLWVGTYDGGLNRLNQGTAEVVRYQNDPADPASLSHDRVRTIVEDDRQRLWVGTLSGLNLLDRERGTFARYQNDPTDLGSLGDSEILSLFQDRGGILWVGTKSGGLARWNSRTWSFGHVTVDPSKPQGLSERNVSSFAEDRAGRLWVGTYGGGLNVVNRISGEVMHHRADSQTPGSLSGDHVMALLHDHSGVMWVGTLIGGLNRFDPTTERFSTFRHRPDDPASLGADGIMTLFQDRDGELWIGTFGAGLNKLERQTGSFIRYSHDPADPSSLSNPRATSIVEDLTGALWVGTDGGGLNLFDRDAGTFRHFRHDSGDPSSLSADAVYSLHVDPQGTLWVGTRGGLARVLGSSQNPGTIEFETYTERHGLPNDAIYGIESDAHATLWLSTNRGLSRFDPSTGSFRNYRASHGLQADEFHFGAHYRSASGELFFGGINGFNAFLPSRLQTNTHIPPVVLTSFLKSNTPVATARPYARLESIELGFRDDVVTFEFAALDFAAPEENRYAYKLEGFDPNWIDLGTLHRVTYTNLDSGSYVFQLKAANNDGVWNEDGLSLAVRVQPAPWQTWWAYTFYALAAVTMLGTAGRAQRRKLNRVAEYSRELEREVQARTRELADSNAELKSANNGLLEASLTDPLTGLRNRRFLFEHVTRDVALVRRRYYELASGVEQRNIFDLVFMMVDLDHFKSVNDSCGHTAGDRVLLDMRNILLQTCRSSDTVIRWGGDEFLIIARDSDPNSAEQMAERIRSKIEQTSFRLGDGQFVRTTCSIGFALYPFARLQPDMLSWEQILQLADSALYAAKETRNTSVGYLSTATSATVDGIFRLIRESPAKLVKDGSLEIRSHIPDAESVEVAAMGQ